MRTLFLYVARNKENTNTILSPPIPRRPDYKGMGAERLLDMMDRVPHNSIDEDVRCPSVLSSR